MRYALFALEPFELLRNSQINKRNIENRKENEVSKSPSTFSFLFCQQRAMHVELKFSLS